ncbi:MAG: hypothetical protein AAF548_15345 [Actinomycetota bacterium]
MRKLRTVALVAALATLTSSCAIWSWGSNANGQLGNGTTTDSATPIQVGDDVVDVAAGGNHSCRVFESGRLQCWGQNEQGQVGDGTTTDRPSPTSIGTDEDWRLVDAGGTGIYQLTGFTCALKDDDTLWCWGDNQLGQLGEGTTIDRTSPVQALGGDFQQLALGGSSACATRFSSLELWCWGGISAAGAVLSPIKFTTLTGWTSIAAGFRHKCGVRAGELWCWGDNEWGQLGLGDTLDRITPTRVGTDTDWESVGLGGGHSCAVKTTGTLWCFGANDSGQVGDGTTTDRLVPTQVGSAADWYSVAAGGVPRIFPFTGAEGHTCGVRVGNDLWCWGGSGLGQVGNGTTGTFVSTPSQVGVGATWIVVDLGEAHSIALDYND